MGSLSITVSVMLRGRHRAEEVVQKPKCPRTTLRAPELCLESTTQTCKSSETLLLSYLEVVTWHQPIFRCCAMTPDRVLMHGLRIVPPAFQP